MPSTAELLDVESIADDDHFTWWVSGDHAETWELRNGDVSGSLARHLVAQAVKDHHGVIIPGPGELVVHARLMNEHYSRHAWKLTRVPVPARTVYVVTHGRYVTAVEFDKGEAQRRALEGIAHMDSVECEWRPAGIRDREALWFKLARTGRWNNSDHILTTTTVNDSEKG